MKPIPEETRLTLDALQARLNQGAPSAEERSELTEAWFSIANGFVIDEHLPDEPKHAEGEVVLIRHAESAANAGLPTESPASIPLTALGHHQAAELAVRIVDPPSLIVVSPFLRTQQTAAPLMSRHPHVPVEEWPVHEFTYLNPMLYCGTTEAQRGEFAREYWTRCDPHWNDGGGAESFADLIARIDDLERRLHESRESNILVFTHGYFIKALLLRREHPAAPVNAAFMAAFRDGRKNDPLPNTGRVLLPNNGSHGCLSTPA